MKKFLSISLLLSMLFLYGCSTNNKLSADQLFQKKQECASYREKIQQIVKDKLGNREIFSNGYDYVEEIFYSPVLNSCLYTINETSTRGIYDYFSNKAILELDSPLKCNCNETEQKFNQKKKELKGE